MKKALALLFAALILALALPASSLAITAAKAGDLTTTYSGRVCHTDDGCMDWGAYSCQWLYADHATCVGTYDNRSIHGVLWHHVAQVYWRQLSDGSYDRYNQPTLWYGAPLS